MQNELSELETVHTGASKMSTEETYEELVMLEAELEGQADSLRSRLRQIEWRHEFGVEDATRDEHCRAGDKLNYTIKALATVRAKLSLKRSRQGLFGSDPMLNVLLNRDGERNREPMFEGIV